MVYSALVIISENFSISTVNFVCHLKVVAFNSTNILYLSHDHRSKPKMRRNFCPISASTDHTIFLLEILKPRQIRTSATQQLVNSGLISERLHHTTFKVMYGNGIVQFYELLSYKCSFMLLLKYNNLKINLVQQNINDDLLN